MHETEETNFTKNYLPTYILCIEFMSTTKIWPNMGKGPEVDFSINFYYPQADEWGIISIMNWLMQIKLTPTAKNNVAGTIAETQELVSSLYEIQAYL